MDKLYDHVDVLNKIAKYLYNANQLEIVQNVFKEKNLTKYWVNEIDYLQKNFLNRWLSYDDDIKERLIKVAIEYYSTRGL
jgi:adenylate kinase family enzyme